MEKLTFCVTVVLAVLVLQLFPTFTYGQVITTGADTVEVATATSPADTAQQKQFFLSNLKNLDKPGKAALRSAILPGLGQAYNRSYWKIPIIYAGAAVMGYFLVTNNSTYQDLRYALIARLDGDPNTIDSYSAHPYLGEGHQNGSQNLRYYRDYYRRNRDLTIILSVAAWGLNVAEAYVHAHLKDFDVSDNLSLHIQPDMIHVPATSRISPGLTLTLYTR